MVGLAVIIIDLLGYSLSLGKDQVVMEVVKAIIFIISGGAGGYAMGQKSGKNCDKKD